MMVITKMSKYHRKALRYLRLAALYSIYYCISIFLIAGIAHVSFIYLDQVYTLPKQFAVFSLVTSWSLMTLTTLLHSYYNKTKSEATQ